MSDAIVTGHWNIPWLHDLPDQWQVVSSKRLFSARKELARPDDEQLAETQAYGVIPQREYERRVSRRVVQITQNLEKRRHVERDDFIISMRSFEGGLERAWASGCIRSSYVVLKPSDAVHTGFFKYLLKSHDYIEALRATLNFIRDGQDLNMSNFSLVDLPLPPKDERDIIARYLDIIDIKVRQFIRVKKKLIALLNEQKRAIIHRAVTRGLDPNVKLKPSEIPWLGDVPEGWLVSRAKTEFRCLNYGRIPLSSTDRGKMTVRQHDYYGTSGVIDKVEDFLFDDRLLLIAEDGANLVLRNLPLAIIAEGKFCVDNHAHILKPRRGNIRFLAAILEGLNFRPWISGAAQPKLTQDRLMGIAIAVPSGDLQQEIIESCDAATTKLTSAIVAANREVALIQEFRTRLIADVVTGKLDVRAAAASLPDTTELEPIDEPAEDEDLDDAMVEAETEEVAA